MDLKRAETTRAHSVNSSCSCPVNMTHLSNNCIVVICKLHEATECDGKLYSKHSYVAKGSKLQPSWPVCIPTCKHHRCTTPCTLMLYIICCDSACTSTSTADRHTLPARHKLLKAMCKTKVHCSHEKDTHSHTAAPAQRTQSITQLLAVLLLLVLLLLMLSLAVLTIWGSEAEAQDS
jgi:hypothetical protein